MLTTSVLIYVDLHFGGTYSIGDSLGPTTAANLGSGIVIPNAARQAGGGGVVQSVSVYDFDNQGAPMDLFFFAHADWGPPADNTPWVLRTDGAHHCVGTANVNTYVQFAPDPNSYKVRPDPVEPPAVPAPVVNPTAGRFGFAVFPNGAIPYACQAADAGNPGTNLYLGIKTRGTPTHRQFEGGLRMRFGLYLD